MHMILLLDTLIKRWRMMILILAHFIIHLKILLLIQILLQRNLVYYVFTRRAHRRLNIMNFSTVSVSRMNTIYRLSHISFFTISLDLLSILSAHFSDANLLLVVCLILKTLLLLRLI